MPVKDFLIFLVPMPFFWLETSEKERKTASVADICHEGPDAGPLSCVVHNAAVTGEVRPSPGLGEDG